MSGWGGTEGGGGGDGARWIDFTISSITPFSCSAFMICYALFACRQCTKHTFSSVRTPVLVTSCVYVAKNCLICSYMSGCVFSVVTFCIVAMHVLHTLCLQVLVYYAFQCFQLICWQ